MAKNNNLGDFLTDIANAIRKKKGTSGSINAQNFASEIASIESSGGGGTSVAVSKSDVNLYDYDGTLLYSYTQSAFLALSALPNLPTREGLTCQGWNYSFNKAKLHVLTYGVLDIGAMYITNDEKTRLYIKIAEKGRMTVPLYFSQTVSNGVTIDWGDGSATQVLSGTGNKNITHTYAEIGEYTISLNPSSGCTLGFGSNSISYCVMGDTGNNGRVYCNMLQAVEIGKNVTSIGNYAFANCYSLASVVIPDSVTSIGSNTFQNCYSLASVIISSGVTSIGSSVFNYCYSLTSVIISSGVKSIGTYAFQNCHSLAYVLIPSNVTSIGNGVFQNCYSLASIKILSNVTSIGGSVFNYCYSLASVVIPSGVTSIGSNAFVNCYGMAFYDFRAAKSVPTLSNTNAFSSISSDCKIVVPDSLYSSWTTATNWSTYASQIVKTSAFNE